MFHTLLKRQLRKSNLDENTLPSIEQWQAFLGRINRAYNETDQERYLLERSLNISSTEMQELYEKLQKSETRYALASRGANDGLWDWNLIDSSAYYSDRCFEIVGTTAETEGEPDIKWWVNKIHRSDKKRVVTEFTSHIEGETEYYQTEYRILKSDGEYRWLLARGLAVRDQNGVAVRIAGSITDITDRKATEQKLAHDAIHDVLTGLPNRKFLMDRLSRSLARKNHSKGSNFAVLFIDLDKFKVINDTLGHQAGDELLIKVAKKLSLIVRPSDMVVRLGGDEFVILLENIKDEKQVLRVAERINKELKKPLRIFGKWAYISASIGIALSTGGYDDPDNFVRDADIAMYCAKLKGRGGYEVFNKEMHLGAISNLQLQNDLRNALENNELLLNYQPIMSLENNQIVGFEALIRWQHPIRGMVMPNDFIPIAEETRLILPIGNWVLHESCRQMKEWQKEFPATENFVMNVNLSPLQIEQEDLIEQVAKVLRETELSSDCLKLEITESVLMKNTERSIKTVSGLREMGVKVSIDDFGTGYSSLSYLHNFSFDTLKVDRSFINLIGSEKDKTEIIQTIITLALSLGIDVVAEGVETLEQLEFLKAHNCNYGQGYYYSKPVNSLTATQMIENIAGDQFNFQTAEASSNLAQTAN